MDAVHPSGALADAMREAHSLPASDVLRLLDTSTELGLSESEVQARRVRFGTNTLRRQRPAALMRIVLNQLQSAVVALLAAAALIAFAFGEWKEAAAIAIVLLINTTIGLVTELRAVRSMEALRALATHASRVRRNGALTLLPSEDLVPGDIVLFEAGDIVTADLRLVEASNLAVDESTLTGESLAVSKQVQPVAPQTTLAERNCMIFKGTAVTRGSALGVVLATGGATELGAISRLVEEARTERSPLEKQLQRLSGQLVIVTLVAVTLIGMAGMATGQDIYLMVESAIALAVAAIPEGLPIVATMALARGMWRMARQNALIERLAAVETLGATTTIFSDKTGTLTENRMRVSDIWLQAGRISIAGTPLALMLNGESMEPAAVEGLGDALTAMVLCNNAQLQSNDDDGVGDPLEVALLQAGRLGGFDQQTLTAQFPRKSETAFDADIKMMATVHGTAQEQLVFVKGAPEAVLRHVSHVMRSGGQVPIDEKTIGDWLRHTETLAQTGTRVLALAMKQAPGAPDDPYADLAFIGLLGLSDPPRADVADAIARCRSAGIRIVMMTGDHAATARSIAMSIGLTDDAPVIMEGAQLKPAGTLSQQELSDVRAVDVFARVTPRQKLELVSIYQSAGEIVAMTGDGVNDAPALKKADIGIAMGLRGTQVAREAAAMVLRDDAFATIVVAIREGRVIFRNIQSFVTYLLSCNLGEILIIGLAILSGLPLPLLPLQILFLNLVTDVFPAFALATGEGSSQVLDRPPRAPNRPMITPVLWFEIIGHSISITAATLAALMIALHGLGHSAAQATTVSFLTLAFAQLWHVFNMRDPRSSLLSNTVTRNPLVWLALALCTALIAGVVYTPATAAVLRLHQPDGQTWLLILSMSLVPLAIGQIGKALSLLRFKRRVSASGSTASD